MFTAFGRPWPEAGSYVRCPEGEVVLTEKELQTLLSQTEQGDELVSAVFGNAAGSFTVGDAEQWLLDKTVQMGERQLAEWCGQHCVTLTMALEGLLTPDVEPTQDPCQARRSEIGHTQAYGTCEQKMLQFLQLYRKK